MTGSSKYDPRGCGGRPHRRSIPDLLSRYTVSETGCWEWTGSQNGHGYGLLSLMVNGQRTTIGAHRLQWMHCHGNPGDLVVMHQCDNRACINPDHLRLGTAKDNVHGMMVKGRAHQFETLEMRYGNWR